MNNTKIHWVNLSLAMKSREKAHQCIVLPFRLTVFFIRFNLYSCLLVSVKRITSLADVMSNWKFQPLNKVKTNAVFTKHGSKFIQRNYWFIDLQDYQIKIFTHPHCTLIKIDMRLSVSTSFVPHKSYTWITMFCHFKKCDDFL